MPLPELSKQHTKIISLTVFTITTIIKLIAILILNGLMDSACIAGWHVNEELSNYILLLACGLIPDIFMLMCIGAGIVFQGSNIGADPGTIIYNFIVGLLNIGCLFTFFGVEDCKSDNLSKIKSLGVYAFLAGLLHITNGIVCLIFMAAEERTETEPGPSVSHTKSKRTADSKPSTSTKASSTKASSSKASSSKASSSK